MKKYVYILASILSVLVLAYSISSHRDTLVPKTEKETSTSKEITTPSQKAEQATSASSTKQVMLKALASLVQYKEPMKLGSDYEVDYAGSRYILFHNTPAKGGG